MKEYTVSQVNGYIKNLISSDYLLRNIVIRGEISNCKYHSMGHIYFTLKDEASSMPCVMFKGSIPNGLKFRLEDGQAVLITGSINVYERDGRYQLYANKILLADDGTGKLAEEYEKLKIKLYEEAYSEASEGSRYCNSKDRCCHSGYYEYCKEKKSLRSALSVSGQGAGRRSS